MGYAVLGKSLPKVDAKERISGRAAFCDDIILPGMLQARILRSKHPHARILNIDTSRAERLPGVKAVATAKDAPDTRFGSTLKDQVIFAKDKVRHIGEPIAAVAAIDEDVAEEALGLIEVTYEELPAVLDPQAALQPDAPLVHEALESYVTHWPLIRKGNCCAHVMLHQGDAEAGFKESDFVFEDTFRTPMVQHAHLEPHGAVASFDASGRVTVWTTTQGVFLTQSQLAECLWMPMTKIRVIGTYVGGAFGGKFNINVEPVAVVLARKANRPVKIMLTREEELTASRVRHPAIMTLKTGVKKDGALVARDARLIYDTGAYAEDGPTIVGNGVVLCRGPYRIPNVHVHGYCVYTNKVMSGAFRGFGDPQVTFAYESQMDIIAEKLGIDPLEIRLKNVIESGDRMAHGQELRAVGLKASLLKAAERAQWGKPAGKNRGKGIALTQHGTGLLSSCAFVRLNEDGTVTLQVGAVDLGSGSNTTLAQIAAEEMGVPLENVAVVSADTDATPYDFSSCADRVAYTAGNAVKLAAADAKKQLLERAAATLEAKVEDLEAREAKVYVKGSPDRSVSMFDLGIASHYFAGGPILGRGSYIAKGRPFDPNTMKGHPMGPHSSFAYGAQIAEVEVDPVTGKVDVLKVTAAHDVGQALNPQIIEGQIEGGVTQGMGYALTEEIVADHRGKVGNRTLLDYRVPTAMDAPKVEPIIVEEYDETGPFGAKGVGEPPLIAAAPAIANAIHNAAGVRLKELPITSEKVFKALKEKVEGKE